MRTERCHRVTAIGQANKLRYVRLELFNFDRDDVANVPPAVLVTRHYQTKTRRGWRLVVSLIRKKRWLGAKIWSDLSSRKDNYVTIPRCDPNHVTKLGSLGRIIDPAYFAEQGPKGYAGEACLLDAAASLIRDRHLLRGKPLQRFQIELLRMLHLAAK